MSVGDKADRKASAVTNHLVQREALRASAEGGKSGKPPLEAMLARISAEVTAQADERRAEAKRAGPR